MALQIPELKVLEAVKTMKKLNLPVEDEANLSDLDDDLTPSFMCHNILFVADDPSSNTSGLFEEI